MTDTDCAIEEVPDNLKSLSACRSRARAYCSEKSACLPSNSQPMTVEIAGMEVSLQIFRRLSPSARRLQISDARASLYFEGRPRLRFVVLLIVPSPSVSIARS